MSGNRPALGALLLAPFAGAAHATDVAVCTDQGRFVIELADEQSPRHVANFLEYVDMAYYSGTVFHRVVGGFVVQGGGYDRELRGRPTLSPVENESRNGLSNLRGTVAAARTSDPHSATAQFYVNLEDNASLDAADQGFGYTVFGRVKDGIQVLDQVGQLPTGASGPFPSDVPMPLIAVRSIARLDEAALAELAADDRPAAIKERIAAAAAAGDHAAALAWIERYRADCGPADAEISMLEADAALKTNLRRRAVFVLEEYFAVTDSSDSTYGPAVALYRTAVPENQASAAQLVGDCEPPATPALPDGASATMDAMVAGQTAVREFVAAAEGHLECLAKIIDDQARAPELRNAAIAEHNRTVSAMEQTAGEFNAQLRIFRARE
jgi:cyclophilin family peptidyl-prolyl cis-trans isomerase